MFTKTKEAVQRILSEGFRLPVRPGSRVAGY